MEATVPARTLLHGVAIVADWDAVASTEIYGVWAVTGGPNLIFPQTVLALKGSWRSVIRYP